VDIEMIENLGTFFVFVPILSKQPFGLMKKGNNPEVFFSRNFKKRSLLGHISHGWTDKDKMLRNGRGWGFGV
jgi:hypothetical protein